MPSGERFESRIKYFDYGVVCVELEMSFETDWEALAPLSSRLTRAFVLEAMVVAILAIELVHLFHNG